MKNLIPVEWSNQRILTTAQLAECYNCAPKRIHDNFQRAKEHFAEGVHYFKLEGEPLRRFKHRTEKIGMVVPPSASMLYLWTEQGAARHCKMINTKEAWEVFGELERAYFANRPEKGARNFSDPSAASLAELTGRVAALEEEMAGLKLLLEEWIATLQKRLPAEERAEKLIALADKIDQPDKRDLILFQAANLLVGKKIF